MGSNGEVISSVSETNQKHSHHHHGPLEEEEENETQSFFLFPSLLSPIDIRVKIGYFRLDTVNKEDELERWIGVFHRKLPEFLSVAEPAPILETLVSSALICAQNKSSAETVADTIRTKISFRTSKPACLKMRVLWLVGELLREEYAPYVKELLEQINIRILVERFIRNCVLPRDYHSELRAIYKFWKTHAPEDTVKLMKGICDAHFKKAFGVKNSDRLYSCEMFYKSEEIRGRTLPDQLADDIVPRLEQEENDMFLECPTVDKLSEPEYYSQQNEDDGNRNEITILYEASSSVDERREIRSRPPPEQPVGEVDSNSEVEVLLECPSVKKLSSTLNENGRKEDDITAVVEAPTIVNSSNSFEANQKNPFSVQVEDLLSAPPGPDVPRAVNALLLLCLKYGNDEQVSGVLSQQMLAPVRRSIKSGTDYNKSVRILWVLGALYYSQHAKLVKAIIGFVNSKSLATAFCRCLTRITEEARGELREILRFWETVVHPSVISSIIRFASSKSGDYSWLNFKADNNSKDVGITAFYSKEESTNASPVDLGTKAYADKIRGKENRSKRKRESDPGCQVEAGAFGVITRVNINSTFGTSPNQSPRNGRDTGERRRGGTGSKMSRSEMSKEQEVVRGEDVNNGSEWGTYNYDPLTQVDKDTFYLKQNWTCNEFVCSTLHPSVTGWNFVRDEGGFWRILVNPGNEFNKKSRN